MRRIVLRDADFVICDASTVQQGASVVVGDGMIEAIGPGVDRALPPGDATQAIDCRGLMLMPGLVNAHTHLYQVLTRGVGKDVALWDWVSEVTYPCARALSPQAYGDAVRLACADAIRNGTTAVVDHPTHHTRFFANESVAAIRASGLRGAVVRAGADASKVDPREVRPLETDLAEAAEFVERAGTSGRVSAWLGPSGFHSCSPDGLARFKALAERLGTRFHFHLAEAASSARAAVAEGFEGEASRALALGLLDERTSVAHAVWLKEPEIAQLAASGCHVVHCPTSNQILASGIADVPAMLRHGVPLALGTDGASSNDSQDMFAEQKSMALIHRATSLDPKAVSTPQAFHAATEGGARALGLARVGRVTQGWAADIIAVRLAGNPCLTPCNDPLATVVYQACGRDVCLNMVEGEILYHDGTFTTLDVDAIIGRVSSVRARAASIAQQP